MFTDHIALHGEEGDDGMKNAIVIDANEVKEILAAHFHVPESNVIKSQYSYTVILDERDSQKTE